MAICPVCHGWRVVHRNAHGTAEPIKAGESEADAHTEDCPACDGLGLDSEDFATRERD